MAGTDCVLRTTPRELSKVLVAGLRIDNDMLGVLNASSMALVTGVKEQGREQDEAFGILLHGLFLLVSNRPCLLEARGWKSPPALNTSLVAQVCRHEGPPQGLKRDRL